MRSPVAISNGWAPVLASYSAITLFTSSMSAVAGSYSRIVVSPWDEKVRILAFMLDLLRDRRFAIFCGTTVSGVWFFQHIWHRFSLDIFRKLSGHDPLFPRILSPESHSKFPFSERTTLLTPYSSSLVSGADHRV